MSYPVTILRDTGCAQSLILSGVIPDMRKAYTGQHQVIEGVGGTLTSVPLVQLDLECNIINDNIKLGVITEIPVEGVSLIIGNDVAGERVTPERPRLIETPETMPSCVTTRAMAKTEAFNQSHVDSHNETILGQDCFPANIDRAENVDSVECSDYNGDSIHNEGKHQKQTKED